MTATTQPRITLTELSRQIDGTRLDALINRARRDVDLAAGYLHAAPHDADAIATHIHCTGVLASLIRLREIEGRLREPTAWYIDLHGPVDAFFNEREARREFQRRQEKWPQDAEERKLIPLYAIDALLLRGKP